MPGEVGEVLREVSGEQFLDRFGHGAMQFDLLRNRERRLDGIARERVDEAVVAERADLVDQAVRDRFIDERQALRDWVARAMPPRA